VRCAGVGIAVRSCGEAAIDVASAVAVRNSGPYIVFTVIIYEVLDMPQPLFFASTQSRGPQ
jgi:hypothetical protein